MLLLLLLHMREAIHQITMRCKEEAEPGRLFQCMDGHRTRARRQRKIQWSRCPGHDAPIDDSSRSSTDHLMDVLERRRVCVVRSVGDSFVSVSCTLKRDVDAPAVIATNAARGATRPLR